MKKVLLLLLFIIQCSHAEETSEIFVLDAIERVIIMAADKPGKSPDEAPSPRQTMLITARQLQLPDLAGRMLPPELKLEEVTRMGLYSMYGNRFGIMQAEEEVDKYISMIAQSNKMKPGELKRVFTSAGRTEDEGKAEIADSYRAKAVMQMKVGDGMVVSRRKVEEYFKEHPELHEASYNIQYACVPFSSVKNSTEQKEELEQYAKTGDLVPGIAWADPFWVARSEVAQEKSYIFNLKPGEIASPLQSVNGFELYRMNEAKNPTLEDRYDEIVQILQQPMIEERQKEFEQSELFEKAAIFDLTVRA